MKRKMSPIQKMRPIWHRNEVMRRTEVEQGRRISDEEEERGSGEGGKRERSDISSAPPPSNPPSHPILWASRALPSQLKLGRSRPVILKHSQFSGFVWQKDLKLPCEQSSNLQSWRPRPDFQELGTPLLLLIYNNEAQEILRNMC